MRLVLTLLCSFLIAVTSPVQATGKVEVSGDLPRRAALEFQARTIEGVVQVANVTTGSPAARAGLRDDDVIIAVNGQRSDNVLDNQAAIRRAVGSERLNLIVRRDGRERRLSFTPDPLPYENLEGLDTYYGVIDAPDGARLRTIVTRPAGTSGRLPAIFFLQWVGCESVEFTDEGAWLDVYRGIAQRSGVAFLRVERASSGDSEGPDCHELDYDTELAHYRHTLEQFLQSPHVDPERVVVMGNSLGGAMAPLVADGYPVAGVTIAGAGGLTYFERMVHFDRQFLEHGDPAEIHPRLLAQVRFHVEYLLNGKTPEQIAEEAPELGAVWRQIQFTGNGTHYGRPYAYHHQAARKNFMDAWARIDAPVLVIYNEYDQFENRRGAQVIVEVINRLQPGSARFVEMPMLGHSFYLYPSADAAFARERRVPAPEPAIEVLLDWLRSAVGTD